MVEFLLHNTIGAWWCAKEGIQGTSGGAGVPPGKSPVQMPYLRWREDGTPAAGKFEGWPKSLKKFTLLDPCCGSGHFLVSAFNLLVPLRMHDENLSAREACDAVLRENLHGLELDPRCTQIAAFALALAAWKYPAENGEPLGYRELPSLNIACSGQGVAGERADWQKLANGNNNLRFTLGNLYDLFQKAPHLGSLIDPRTELGAVGITGSLEQIQPLLTKAIAKSSDDVELASVGVAAQGIAAAADLLARQYALVITNVPYLGRGKQEEVLKAYIETHYAVAKADLATAFVLRCIQLCAAGGSTALVTPQNWLFLTSYKKLREELLNRRQWNLVARLGPRAFETISGEVVNVALLAISAVKPADAHRMAGLDVADAKTPTDKAVRMADRVPTPVQVVEQAGQIKNPSATITVRPMTTHTFVGDYADSFHGISTTDYPRFGRAFWESEFWGDGWIRQQGTVEQSKPFSGREMMLKWDHGNGPLQELRDLGSPVVITGLEAWRKRGIIISQMNSLPCGIYDGYSFDDNVGVLIPKHPDFLPALWAFCESSEFNKAVREINQKMIVQYVYYPRVPFDLAHWQAIAAETYPKGLPEPHSDDPTQWLFKGDIATSDDPLQVAVARLLGYRWPDQPMEDAVVNPFVDDDGIVCLPGVRHEAPAAERLADLLRGVGYKTEVDLAAWLRDKFFEEHCKRFQNRPFIWHIWDGRKDGFSALVNYHKLNHKTLENLTYSYLGDWISAQSKSDKAGADLRLAAAQALQEKLKLILAGEPPYEIFVRWKPVHEQAIGWYPDLNDGVRMNIRPFVEAEILRKTPNIKWTKDRGKEPERDKHDFPWFWSSGEFVGDRVNDVHLTNEKKTAARSRKKGAK
jgi:hypothetical protein